MEKVKMKYLGSVPTRVLQERGGNKVDVNEGDVIEMEEVIAKEISKTYKGVWIPEGSQENSKVGERKKVDEKHPVEEAGDVEENDVELPEAPQVEGGLDEEKVEKTVPKKAKK